MAPPALGLRGLPAPVDRERAGHRHPLWPASTGLPRGLPLGAKWVRRSLRPRLPEARGEMSFCECVQGKPVSTAHTAPRGSTGAITLAIRVQTHGWDCQEKRGHREAWGRGRLRKKANPKQNQSSGTHRGRADSASRALPEHRARDTRTGGRKGGGTVCRQRPKTRELTRCSREKAG